MTRVPVLDTSNRIDARHLPVLSSALVADFNEAAQDAIAAAFASGSHQNITVTYNDVTNSFNLSVAGLAETDQEVVRDTIAAALVAGPGVSITANDAANTITIGTGGTVDVEVIRDTIGTALRGGNSIQVALDDAADTITISTTATNRANHTGTQLSSTISDFAVAVQAAAPSGTYVSQDTLVWNAKNHGVYGDGTTDDTAAINALSSLANAASPHVKVFFPPGNYKISSEVNFTAHLDATQATFTYSGTGTAVSIGYTSSLTANKIFKLPQIVCETQGWGTQAAPSLRRGLYLVNLKGCDIHIPYVKWFNQGVRLQSIGGFTTRNNNIFLGQLNHNRRQFIMDLDTTAGGECDYNIIMGGNFDQASNDPTTTSWVDDVQTAQIQVGASGGGRPSNNTFVGLYLGGDNPAYYRMECNGNNNAFINCSWLYQGTRHRILWGTEAYSNRIDGGRSSESLQPTDQSTFAGAGYGANVVASPAGIVPGMLMMFGGAAAPSGWLLCQGQALARTDYPLLFTYIGTLYGAGNGTTTFNLPNFFDRVPLGSSSTRPRGTQGGSESATSSITLTTANLPLHNHTIAHGHTPQTTSGVSTYHVHNFNHGHPGSTTGGDGVHKHTVSFSDNTGTSGNHIPKAGPNETGTSSGAIYDSGNHTHATNTPVQYQDTSATGEHTHVSYTSDFNGGSGQGTGSSTPIPLTISVLQPYLSVNYVIKF